MDEPTEPTDRDPRQEPLPSDETDSGSADSTDPYAREAGIEQVTGPGDEDD